MQDTTSPHTWCCQWCPQHQRAWVGHPWYGPPCWHPLPRGMLYTALKMAEAAGCANHITIVLTACDVCGKAQPEEKAS